MQYGPQQAPESFRDPQDNERGYSRPENAKWIGKPVEQWDWREKPLVERDWTERWQTAGDLQENRPLRPGTDPGGRNLVWDNTAPTKKVLQLHSGLQKAESALLVQTRTGKIGLGKFLHDCRVH